jgi:hypothetical protein
MLCLRLLVRVKRFFSFCFSKKTTKIEVPWVWIGGKNHQGETIDLTQLVADNLSVGEIVNEEFLFNLDYDCVSWSYIDFKTLNETKIPIEGIQI